MKKLLSFILSLVLLLSFTTVAFADSNDINVPAPLALSSEELQELEPYLQDDEYIFVKDEFQVPIETDGLTKAVTVVNVAIYGTYSSGTGAGSLIKAYLTGDLTTLRILTLSGQSNLFLGNSFQATETFEEGSYTGTQTLIATCRFFTWYSTGTTLVMNATGTVGTNKGSSNFSRSTVYTI